MALINSGSTVFDNDKASNAKMVFTLIPKDVGAGIDTLAERLQVQVGEDETLDNGDPPQQRNEFFMIDDSNADLTAAGWSAGDAAILRPLLKKLHDAWRLKRGH